MKLKQLRAVHIILNLSQDKKSLLLDHISEAYNTLSIKYGKGLHFVIGGDTNDLKLDSILSLDRKFVQVVQKWTRLNPPAILDPVMMTLSKYYQEPCCLEPLDPDPEKKGAQSEHRIVLILPINTIDNKSIRNTREIKVRPFPESGLNKFKDWIMDENWDTVYEAETAYEKAKVF